METHDELIRFIDFDDSDVERIGELREHLAGDFDEFVTETCRDLSVDASSESTERYQRALSDWLTRLFDEPFARDRKTGTSELERMVFSASPWTECLLATLHRLRRHLGHHIREAPEFGAPRQRELMQSSLEKAFDFEVLRLVQARHRADVRGSVEQVASLAAGLSHEICNPLNSISLHLSLLERQLLGDSRGETGHEEHADDPNYSTMLNAVREEIRRIGNFTSELSDFSRPLVLQPVQLDVDAFLADFVQTHAPTLASAGISLTRAVGTTEGSPQKSDGESIGEIYADVDLLEEALLNLVQNAVEAMETSGSIELRLSSTASATHLDVVDSGPGFAERAARQAFDLFFTTKAAGTGLGLPIVQKIAQAHEGRAQILAEGAGGGAAIRISLPRADSEVTSETDADQILQELQRISQL